MVVFQKMEGKTTTLKFWIQKFEGKTTTLTFWIQKLEGKTTTLNFEFKLFKYHEVVEFSFQFFH
jgi:hypothetical protein